MKDVDNYLHKETEKLYQLLRDVQQNRSMQEKVWDDYCKKEATTHNEKQTKTYFKRHPKHLSSSSSEILSPRRSVDTTAKPRRQKPLQVHRHVHNFISEQSSEDYLPSQSSLEVVTVRQELHATFRQDYKEEYVVERKSGPHRSSSHHNIVAMGKEDAVGKVGQKDSARGDGGSKIQQKRKGTGPNSARKASKPTEKLVDLAALDLNVEAKLKKILEKALNSMEDIRMQLDVGVVFPDGDEDLERRKKRSGEFASRFSRNYLYQLNRQINEIQLASKGNMSHRPSTSIVKQKLVSSYQTLLQGLQAYYNHLPISITTAVPEKVKELLKLTTVLTEIHRTCSCQDINTSEEKKTLIDVFEVRSRCLLEKIDERYFNTSSVNILQSDSMVMDYPASKDQKSQSKKKNPKTKSRFSMYSLTPSRKDMYWKKAVEALAKKKFNVPSKYKTANFKHRPPVEKQQVQQSHKLMPKAMKMLEKKSSSSLKQKKYVLNDDNIQTMVQIQTEKDCDSNNSTSQLNTPYNNNNNNSNDVSIRQSIANMNLHGKTDILASLVEKVVSTIKEDGKDVNQDQVKNILQGFLDIVGSVQEPTKEPNNNNGSGKELDVEPLVLPLSDRTKVEDQEGRQVRADGDGPTDDANALLIAKVGDAIRRNEESFKRAKETVKGYEGPSFEGQERKKKERKKTITVSGAKNAQLICIKDEDSSLVEPTSVENESSVPKSEAKPHRKRSSKSKHHQETKHNTSEVLLGTSDRVSKIKISRLPRKPLVPVKPLPKQYALDVIEYKMKYMKARKGNPMYKKSATKQPWVLMGEIADKILDELIHGVGSEIQVDDVINNIYASELAQ